MSPEMPEVPKEEERSYEAVPNPERLGKREVHVGDYVEDPQGVKEHAVVSYIGTPGSKIVRFNNDNPEAVQRKSEEASDLGWLKVLVNESDEARRDHLGLFQQEAIEGSEHFHRLSMDTPDVKVVGEREASEPMAELSTASGNLIGVFSLSSLDKAFRTELHERGEEATLQGYTRREWEREN
jgi:hypothetical protein